LRRGFVRLTTVTVVSDPTPPGWLSA